MEKTSGAGIRPAKAMDKNKERCFLDTSPSWPREQVTFRTFQQQLLAEADRSVLSTIFRKVFRDHNLGLMNIIAAASKRSRSNSPLPREITNSSRKEQLHHH